MRVSITLATRPLVTLDLLSDIMSKVRHFAAPKYHTRDCFGVNIRHETIYFLPASISIIRIMAPPHN